LKQGLQCLEPQELLCTKKGPRKRKKKNRNNSFLRKNCKGGADTLNAKASKVEKAMRSGANDQSEAEERGERRSAP